MTNEQYEERALKSGWTTDPDNFDQWVHPVHPDIYWDACDIPEIYLVDVTFRD